MALKNLNLDAHRYVRRPGSTSRGRDIKQQNEERAAAAVIDPFEDSPGTVNDLSPAIIEESQLTVPGTDEFTKLLTVPGTVNKKINRGVPGTVNDLSPAIIEESQLTVPGTVGGMGFNGGTVNDLSPAIIEESQLTVPGTVFPKCTRVQLMKKPVNCTRRLSPEMGELLSVLYTFRETETEKEVLTYRIGLKAISQKLKCDSNALRMRLKRAIKAGLVRRVNLDANGSIFSLTVPGTGSPRSSSSILNTSKKSSSFELTTTLEKSRVRERKSLEVYWRFHLNPLWEIDGIDVDYIIGHIDSGKLSKNCHKKIIPTIEKLYFAKKHGVEVSRKPVESIRNLLDYAINKNGGYFELKEYDTFLELKKKFPEVSDSDIIAMVFNHFKTGKRKGFGR